VIENFGCELDINEYNWFTDIEFNPGKSINCQARAVAIYKLIQEKAAFNVLHDRSAWINYHTLYVKG